MRPCLLLLVLALGCDGPDDGGVDAASLSDAAILSDAGSRSDAGPPADLDGFIAHHMAAGGVPGLAAAIVRGDEVVWLGTYGYADLERMRPVADDTLFIVASISKTVTAVRALQLVEAGTLDLDAPLEDYVPYAVRHPDYPGHAITTRMLLTHSSGLRDDFLTLGSLTITGGDPTETLAGFAEGYVVPGGAYYDESNWGAEPETEHEYSNAGFGVIGDVIERAGGESFRDQTRAAIFEPLAMDGAGWFLADVDQDRLAIEHLYNGRRYTALDHHGYAFYPASSLRVSVRGLARFVQAILRGGELEGTRVLTSESVDELLRRQTPALDRGQALAFSDRRVNGHVYVGHGGTTFGASAELLISREADHGIVLLTNSDAYLRARLGMESGEEAMDAILARLDEEALAR